MVKRVAGLFLLSSIALFAAATGAVAQRQPNPAVVAACSGDAQQLCHNVQRGGGRIAQCLKEHAMELSAGCKGALRAAREQQPR